MSKFPEHIRLNLARDRTFYAMSRMDNIEKSKIDPDYLGDVLLFNEPLIWHSVHKYIGKPETIVRNYCVEKDDILQLGRIGFIKAIKAFDITRNVKFSSFSVPAITREIRCFLRDSASIIRPTRTANELIQKINRLEHELGYTPTTEDLAVILDESEERITKALRVGQPVKYLEESIGQGEKKLTYMDFIEDSASLEVDVIDKVYTESVIDSVSSKLSDKEISVLNLRVSGLNQTQTAEKENISQMRVSRIMKKVAHLLSDPDTLSVV